MSKKIDPKLLKELRAATKTNPALEVPLIITLKPGASVTALEDRVQVQHFFESISAASSNMTLEQALQLAKLEAVVRIEYDGEIHTLKRRTKK